MEANSIAVYDIQGKEVEKISLDRHIFDGEVNSGAIYQAINAYRANQRKGLASTKDRSEVSGGGAKPWRQKGTGRARVGSNRSPLWRHGGVTFGPSPRDYSINLPQKIKNLALKSTLNVKLKENNFIVLDKLGELSVKTKQVVSILANLKITKKEKITCLLLLAKDTAKELKLALRNIDFLSFNQSIDANAYEVLASQKLIVTKEGLIQLVKRLKGDK